MCLVKGAGCFGYAGNSRELAYHRRSRPTDACTEKSRFQDSYPFRWIYLLRKLPETEQKFGIDYVYANELEVIDGKLTGRYLGEVVDGKRKAELLRLIAQVENVDIRQTVAVGDGANDLPMISIAGLGIAFHAKPKVKATAEQSISTIGLDGILYFLGYKDSYLNEHI